jgi:hypothetical protein
MALGISSGSWAITSAKDPRWNCSGHAQIISIWQPVPEEAEAVLNALQKRLGERPDDLKINCVKD